MSWYCVCRSDSGEAVSFGTSLPDPLPTGLVAVALPHAPVPVDPDTGVGEQWDAATRSMVAVAPGAGHVKRQRLGALRAKGWTALTLAEKDEARAICFDLGEPSPPA